MQDSLGTSVQGFGEPRLRVQRLDWLLLLAAVGLIACSIYTIGTATENDIEGSPHYYVIRQAVYGVVGIVLMLLARPLRLLARARVAGGPLRAHDRLDPARVRVRRRRARLEAGDRAAVLQLPGLRAGQGPADPAPCRPSCSTGCGGPNEAETTSRVMLLALIPAMLVIAQPDLGSGLVYIAIAIAVLFVAGTKWTHFAALGAIAAAAIAVVLVAAPAVGVNVLKDYQVDRLTAFVNPSENPQDEGYQQAQAIVAVGSGGKTGRGDEATQTKLDFLPEHHTDFVFAVVGEEFGFAGAAIVLSLFALLIWRSLRILTMSKNLYGALIAGGVTAMLMFQTFVNVGMNIGIMPITGVTLPLMSYGGSSVIVTFLALGLLQSIHAQARETAFAKRQHLAL